MQIFAGSNQVLKRYLTLFYGFALGLALILGILAIIQPGSETPDAPAITQVSSLTQIASSTQDGTPVHSSSIPTAFPDIPPTPNIETPSTLGVTASDLNGVEVSLWYPWTGSMGAAFQTMLDEFSHTNQWGITVQAGAFEGFGSLDDAVEASLASKTFPDVLVDYGYQLRHWDGSGVVTDLTPYVNDPVWGLARYRTGRFLLGILGGRPGECRLVKPDQTGRDSILPFSLHAVLQPELGVGARLPHSAYHSPGFQNAGLCGCPSNQRTG